MPASTSTSLLTDMYELTMLDAAEGWLRIVATPFGCLGAACPPRDASALSPAPVTFSRPWNASSSTPRANRWLKTGVSEPPSFASWRFTNIWGRRGRLPRLSPADRWRSQITLLETLPVDLNHDCARWLRPPRV